MICESMVEHIQPNVFQEKFYPALKELSKDPVPNVRFIVARIFIQQLFGNGKYNNIYRISTCSNIIVLDSYPNIQNELKEVQPTFAEDSDREVRFYSQKS